MFYGKFAEKGDNPAKIMQRETIGCVSGRVLEICLLDRYHNCIFKCVTQMY
jgi:hypothetical protein